MKKVDKKRMVVSTLACMLPMLLGVIMYTRLPEQLPTHWNVQGEIDGYSSKNFALFGLPFILVVVNIICQFAILADPKRENYSGKLQSLVIWMLPVLSLMIQIITIVVGLGHKLDVTAILTLFVGVLLIAMGNYLPKCKQNYTIGYKLPWTLDDEENWNKTHRLAGWLMVVSGILVIIAVPLQLVLPAMIVVLVITLVPAVYSYVLYVKKNRKEDMAA